MRPYRLAAVAVFGVLAACGGRPLEQRIERHPAEALPLGASQIFHVRVGTLRNNPLATLLYEQAHRLELGPSLKGTSQTIQLLGGISRLVCGFYSADERSASSAVALLSGTFDEAAFRKALDSSGIPYVTGRQDNREFYTCGRGDARCYVSFSSRQLVVAASQEGLLKRTLDLARGRAKSMTADRAFAPLLADYSPDLDLWATGHFPATLTAMLGPRLQGVLQAIQAFAIKVQSGEKSGLGLVLHCASGEAAQANASVLRDLLASLVQDLVDAGYEIPDLVRALNDSRIVLDGAKADFGIQMSRAEVAATAGALRVTPKPPQVAPIPPAEIPPALLPLR